MGAVFQGREKGIICLKPREGQVCKLRGEREPRVFVQLKKDSSPGEVPGTFPRLMRSHKGSGVGEGQGQMCKGRRCLWSVDGRARSQPKI